jgi:hypothetical protein
VRRLRQRWPHRRWRTMATRYAWGCLIHPPLNMIRVHAIPFGALEIIDRQTYLGHVEFLQVCAKILHFDEIV